MFVYFGLLEFSLVNKDFLKIKIFLRKPLKNSTSLPNRVFFFSILWFSQIGNHPQEEFAKFGYKLERKVKHFENLAIFWQFIGTYYLNMAISERKKIFEIWQLWHIFLDKNHLDKLH